MRSRLLFRVTAALLALLALSSISAAAYEYPLSPEAVREAYFFGRQRGPEVAEFLGRYEKSFPSSISTQARIARVQLLTPYAQIVSEAFYDMLNTTAVDADQKYEGPVPVLVRLWVFLPGARWASNVQFERFKDAVDQSPVIVSQKQPLKPLKTKSVTLYTHSRSGSWADGVEVELAFDSGQFRPAPVQIAVASPDGQHYTATFDLGSLK